MFPNDERALDPRKGLQPHLSGISTEFVLDLGGG
jgi:hypothetical protein